MVAIEEIEVKVETKLHQALIGAGGKGVKKLQGEDCIIHFPSDGSDMVTIRGKAEAVKKAKKALEEEAAQLRLQSFSATVTAAPEFHRFLIGRGGSNMKSIRDETGCRIAVPGRHLGREFAYFLFMSIKYKGVAKTGCSFSRIIQFDPAIDSIYENL